VGIDGMQADDEPFGNLNIGQAFGDKAQDFHFTISSPVIFSYIFILNHSLFV